MWQAFDYQKRFLYGKNDGEKAHTVAGSCPDFREDNEDECVSDEPISCYNCRYRRWTQESFDCMKGVAG